MVMVVVAAMVMDAVMIAVTIWRQSAAPSDC
jgi:hypothetical protein